MNKSHELGGWQEGMTLFAQSKRKGYGIPEVLGRNERVRVRIMGAVVTLVLSVIIARLMYIQVFSQGQNLLLSENNHIEKQVEIARRGNLLDRNGISFTENMSELGKDRKYILNESAAHLIGYLSEVNEKELGCTKGICYLPGQWIGRAGLEKSMEKELKGRDGGKVVEVDAGGREVRNLGKNEPETGQDVMLSVDSRLQTMMMKAMGGRVGSAIALDMNGKVLGIVSSPSYDPNLFTVNPDNNKLQTILADNQAMAFLDRAIAGTYAPGSVFKPVVAYAALVSGKIKSDTLIEDTGEIRIDKYRYGNWYYDQYGRKEGNINLERALARSNDIYFYKVGELVGVDEIVKWAKKFGFGEKTGIELPGEQAGVVPTRLAKERETGEKWFLGNTYHLAIGQGDLLVTPIQVARMTMAVVSGRLCNISVLKETGVKCEELGIPQEYIEAVRSGMRGACSSGGTAFPFFDFSPQVLCKTGTAQHSGQKSESDKPHAWITVAYPADNPGMVLTVMLDSAGEGSYEAGPVASEIIKEWRDLGN